MRACQLTLLLELFGQVALHLPHQPTKGSSFATGKQSLIVTVKLVVLGLLGGGDVPDKSCDVAAGKRIKSDLKNAVLLHLHTPPPMLTLEQQFLHYLPYNIMHKK